MIRKEDGTTESLITVAEFQARVQAGAISPDHTISRDGQHWKRIYDVEGLRQLFGDGSPASPKRSRQATVIGLPPSHLPMPAVPSAAPMLKQTLVGVPVPLPLSPPPATLSEPARKGHSTIIGIPAASLPASTKRGLMADSAVSSTHAPSIAPLGRQSSMYHAETKPLTGYAMRASLWMSRLPRGWVWAGIGVLCLAAWVLAFFILGTLLAGCNYVRQATSTRDNTPQLLELGLLEAPSEEPHSHPLNHNAFPLHEVLAHFRRIEEDNVQGLFLRLNPMGSAWARMEDMREGLVNARKTKKPIHCHFDEADNTAYALAAAGCDHVTMSPSGALHLIGTSIEITYARELLDKLGVRAELKQVGRYKGAADRLTHQSMPPESRESLGAIVRDMQERLVSLIQGRSQLSKGDLKAVFGHGPFTADEALKAGLIDAIGFVDQARQTAKETAHATQVRSLEPQTAKGLDIGNLIKNLTKHADASTDLSGPRVALVVLEGTILDGDSEGLGAIRSGPVIRALRDIENTADIKSVVLRINSPGGSALASDNIWHAVRRLARKKPVIASFGDIAASGGYYIGSAGTEILAQPTSLVGSIGVVGGKVNIAGLLAKLGLHSDVLSSTDYAAWLSPLHPFSEPQAQRLEHLLETTYDRFLSRVATGRGVPVSGIVPAAEGRLFTGKQALEHGLVDGFGGLQTALWRAHELGKVKASTPVQMWPPARDLGELLVEAFGGANPGLSAKPASALDVLAYNLRITNMSPLVQTLLLNPQSMACVLPYELIVR